MVALDIASGFERLVSLYTARLVDCLVDYPVARPATDVVVAVVAAAVAATVALVREAVG